MPPLEADEALERIYNSYSKQLTKYLQNFVDHDEARDVLQDVLESFLRQSRENKIRVNDELAWLYRSCHNRAIDYIRKRKRVTHVGDDSLEKLPNPRKENGLSRWEELRPHLLSLAKRYDAKGDAVLLLHLLESGQQKLLIAKSLGVSDRQLRRKVADLFTYFQQELHKLGITGVDL